MLIVISYHQWFMPVRPLGGNCFMASVTDLEERDYLSLSLAGALSGSLLIALIDPYRESEQGVVVPN